MCVTFFRSDSSCKIVEPSKVMWIEVFENVTGLWYNYNISYIVNYSFAAYFLKLFEIVHIIKKIHNKTIFGEKNVK